MSFYSFNFYLTLNGDRFSYFSLVRMLTGRCVNLWGVFQSSLIQRLRSDVIMTSWPVKVRRILTEPATWRKMKMRRQNRSWMSPVFERCSQVISNIFGDILHYPSPELVIIIKWNPREIPSRCDLPTLLQR